MELAKKPMTDFPEMEYKPIDGEVFRSRLTSSRLSFSWRSIAILDSRSAEG